LELEQRSTSLPPVKGKHLVVAPPPQPSDPVNGTPLWVARCSRFPVRWQRVLQVATRRLPLKSANCSGASEWGQIYEFYGKECRLDELEGG